MGLGCVFRDCDGVVQAALMKTKALVWDVDMAEALAIREAMVFAVENGFSWIIVKVMVSP